MAGYSRENKRQNQALQSILDGGTPEKRIMVAMEDTKEKKERQKQIAKEREKSSERSEALKAARTPWFCPSCDKVMKKRLDDKMYRLYNHCFDCQVEIENKMRIDGTYKEWEENKIRENKIAYIKDQIQAIEEWKNMKSPEFYNNVGVDYPELEKEKWDVDMDKVRKEADEAIKKFTEVLNELESVE